MNLTDLLKLWKKLPNNRKTGLAQTLFIILGLTAHTANDGIHWKIREENFSADFWPTTEKLNVVYMKTGLKESFIGFENIIVKLVRLTIRNVGD